MAEFHQVGGIDNATYHLRRQLAHMLQSYFKEQADVHNLKWDSDIEKTDIFIAEKYPSDTEGRDLRPAIIIERGPFKRSAVALGDDRQALNLQTDERNNIWIMAGQVAFHCVSRYGLQAEAIAWAVHDLIMLYSRSLARRAGLHHIGDSIIGQESPYQPNKNADNWADVPVNIEFFISRELHTEEAPYRPLDGIATSFRDSDQ